MAVVYIVQATGHLFRRSGLCSDHPMAHAGTPGHDPRTNVVLVVARLSVGGRVGIRVGMTMYNPHPHP